eukprot:6198549-Pleurochrysis_carterae.AAC.2
MRHTSWSTAALERGASGASAVSTEAPGVLDSTFCHAASRFCICGRTRTRVFAPSSSSAPAAIGAARPFILYQPPVVATMSDCKNPLELAVSFDEHVAAERGRDVLESARGFLKATRWARQVLDRVRGAGFRLALLPKALLRRGGDHDTVTRRAAYAPPCPVSLGLRLRAPQSHARSTSRPSSRRSTISRNACSLARRPPGAACRSWRTPSAFATSASKSPAMHAHACAYARTARCASPSAWKGIPSALPYEASKRAARSSTAASVGTMRTAPAGLSITKPRRRDGTGVPAVSTHRRAAVPRPASPASSSRYAHGPIMSAKQTSTATAACGPTAATSMSSVYCKAATSLTCVSYVSSCGMRRRRPQYASNSRDARRLAATYDASASSTRRRSVRMRQLPASCAIPLARVHPMAMTSSSSAHTSSPLAPPRSHIAGAANPIFHAPCSA